jgi:hypothetical protein
VAELAVQALAFLGAHDAHGDLGIHGERVADPARDLVARQHGAVLRGVARELQGQGECIKSHLGLQRLFGKRYQLLNQE